MYFTQPGEQLVNIGSTAAWSPSRRARFSRISSSVPSSMIVRSAAKLVSNTLSKPQRRRAVLSSKVTAVPGASPKHSPIAARGLGAVWMTTCLSGSSMAAQTSSVESLARSAPVGQRLMHWPQLMHTTSASGLPMKVEIRDRSPRSSTSRTPTSCRSMQVRRQRRHRTHLLLSRTTAWLEASTA